MFSLIDAAGGVYPCCHLYYDNDIDSERYENMRQATKIGDLTSVNYNFAALWRSSKYDDMRAQLSTIRAKGLYEQCGECTRHFCHNNLLTKLYSLYSGLCPTSREYFERYITKNSPQDVVFF
jgi:hypothetical protein